MTNSEAKRLIKQGAISIDGRKITDPNFIVHLTNTPQLLKIGKHKFLNIIRKKE